MSQPILQIQDLRTHFFTDRGEIPAVDGVSLHVKPGEVLGVVGESGCGKSVTSLSILKLIPQPPGKITGGSIVFKGQDIVPLKEREMRLAIAIVAILGPSLQNALYAIAIVNIPTYGRLVRAKVLSLKNEEYITAAQAIGMRNRGILLHTAASYSSKQPDTNYRAGHTGDRARDHRSRGTWISGYGRPASRSRVGENAVRLAPVYCNGSMDGRFSRSLDYADGTRFQSHGRRSARRVGSSHEKLKPDGGGDPNN